MNFKTQILIIFFGVLLSFSTYSQSPKSSKPYTGFLRVYSQAGDKIAKGNFQYVNDSLLVLKKNKKLIQVNYKNIGFIKTKRSGGHNVVLGAATGAGLGIAVGIGTADPDAWLGYSAGEGALGFGILGALGGGLLGGVVSLAKDPLLFTINGNKENWVAFKNFLEENPR